MRDAIDLIEKISRITAEINTLEWSKDSARINELLREQEALGGLGRCFSPGDACKVLPLFQSLDGDLTGAFVVAATAPSEHHLASGLLDLIVAEATADCAVPISPYGRSNWLTCLHRFGSDIVPPAIAALRATAGTLRAGHWRHELEEWPRGDDGEPIEGEGKPPLIFAPIGTPDDRFSECGFFACDAGAEGATALLMFTIDADDDLRTLVEGRAERAALVLRGAS